jgi:hypothetical protein
VGIVQFIILSIVLLVYLVITGALVLRLIGLNRLVRLSRSN